MAAIFNVNRSSKTPPFSADEFMPRFGEDKKNHELEKIRATAEQMVSLGRAKKKVK